MKIMMTRKVLMYKKWILKQDSRQKNCWLSLPGRVPTVTLATLRINCLDTFAFAVDLVSPNMIRLFCLTVAATIATNRKTKTVNTKFAVFCVILVRVHPATSTCK